ncbi:hypothetical protein PI125_g13329 [Phytophthora idaei]|nr:hypothetical protein PI125_g13329 [Phytophthora idaei]KAG3148454.1 hypothetical protein PI126_g12432 [Phytophthora idaei]
MRYLALWLLVVQETKLIAVRLASTWTSMVLLVKQSVLAVASVVRLVQLLDSPRPGCATAMGETGAATTP